MRELELYLHIPFCVQKCKYCDFLSAPAGEGERQAYVDSLCGKIRSYRELAKALGVGEDELSRALNGHFGEVGRNLSVADVEKLFGEVLDFILDHGVRYRLKRE